MQGGESSGEEDEAYAAVSAAATKALDRLEQAVGMSMNLVESSADAASAEVLAADRVVAAAAQRASAMTKALDMMATAQEAPPAQQN